MAFGFNFNGVSSDPDKAIIFSEAIAPAAGPAASLHLFYSVARAKEMLAQLQAAIAQAEGATTLDYVDMAGDLYRNFCEADYGDGVLDVAWLEYEDKVSTIENNSLAEKLILAAMAHALEYGGNDR